MSFTSVARSRWSDVYIASFAQLFGSLGTFLVMVTLVLALQQRGASGIEVSVLVICEALPMVVLGSLIGHAVDRFDSQALLVLTGAGQVLACLALALASSFEMVIAGAIVLSVVSAVAVPTRQALLPAMVVRDDLPRASAIGQTAGNAGMMIGPALAGFLVGGVGVESTLRLSALGFLATIIAGLTLRTRRGGAARPGQPKMPTPSTSEAASVEGHRREWTLRGDRLLWSAAWGFTAVLASISAVNVVLVFFIMRTLGSTESMYGLIDSMWTVGALIGAWLFSRMVKPATEDVAIARWLFGVLGAVSIAVIAVGSVQAALWIVPCYLFGGAQNGGLNVLAGTLLGRRVPQEAMGRANTALGMRAQAGALIGYIGGGLLLELSEPRWIVLGCGVLGLATVLTVMPIVVRAESPAPAGEPISLAKVG
jgi:MFS family permease